MYICSVHQVRMREVPLVEWPGSCQIITVYLTAAYLSRISYVSYVQSSVSHTKHNRNDVQWIFALEYRFWNDQKVSRVSINGITNIFRQDHKTMYSDTVILHVVLLSACGYRSGMYLHWMHTVALIACSCLGCIWLHWKYGVGLATCGCLACMCLPSLHVIPPLCMMSTSLHCTIYHKRQLLHFISFQLTQNSFHNYSQNTMLILENPQIHINVQYTQCR